MSDDEIDIVQMGLVVVSPTSEHPPELACAQVHCSWHEVDEPGPGYQRCRECGHLYLTAADLRRAYRETLRAFHDDDVRTWLDQLRYWKACWLTRAKNIDFCQECVHDF